MTIEYVLIIGLFSVFMMGVLAKGPFNAFENAGPKLGARVERQLTTGQEFGRGEANWQKR